MNDLIQRDERLQGAKEQWNDGKSGSLAAAAVYIIGLELALESQQARIRTLTEALAEVRQQCGGNCSDLAGILYTIADKALSKE